MRATSALTLRRKRVSPFAFRRRRSDAPRPLPSFPLKRKNIIAAIGPVPTMRTSPPSCALHLAIQRVDDARERIQQRGRLVGEVRRDSPEAALHDALRNEEKIREGAEERPLERGRAEVLPARAAVVAAPAGAGHGRGDALAGRKGRSRARRLDDTRELVPERERKRKLRMAALQELEVGRARERDENAHEDLSRPRPRGRDLEEREPLRPLRDESPHGKSLAGR